MPGPIPARSVAPERGWSCQVCLWQPGAEINASSWSLGCREQGGAGSDPSPVRNLASQDPPLLFISLEGVSPTKTESNSTYSLKKNEASTAPTRTPPQPPLSVPLCSVPPFSALTQGLAWLSASVSPSVGVGGQVCCVSPRNSGITEVGRSRRWSLY